MTRKEEEYLLDSIEQIRDDVRLNNMMLCDIIGVINTYLANYSRENDADFGRNILANLLANGIDVTRFFKK